MEITSAKEFTTPILHEDSIFGYYDEHGDRIGALCIAKYYSHTTVLTHNGCKTVRDDLYKLKPEKLHFGGEDVAATWAAPAADGSPRFIIDHGYSYYYGEIEVDEYDE